MPIELLEKNIIKMSTDWTKLTLVKNYFIQNIIAITINHILETLWTKQVLTLKALHNRYIHSFSDVLVNLLPDNPTYRVIDESLSVCVCDVSGV